MLRFNSASLRLRGEIFIFSFILGVFVLSTGIAFTQNTNLSKGHFFDGEPYLVINPGNPRHLVAAWMGYTPGTTLSIKTIVSFDGGQTWSAPVTLPHLSPAYQSADPSMVFDRDGNVLACYVDYRQSPDNGGIILVRSTDGGLSWNYLSKAMDAWADGDKKPIDRPWLTVNRSSNHMYITSKPAPWIAPPNRPYFIFSGDGGATWNPWRYIDGPGYLTGNYIKAPMAAPAVAADGVFHCLYPSWVVSQNLLPGYLHAKSSDDGATFSYSGAVYASAGMTDTLAKGGGHLEADPTDPAHLAFVFPGALFGDLDIFFIESHDAGESWTGPIRLNDDPAGNGKMQDLVWSAFDADGDFAVAWRDRRNGADTGYAVASEIRGSIRRSDSLNFSRNFVISDTLAAYANVLSLNGNDFMALSVARDTLHAAWGETRNGILNIWYARTDLRSLTSQGIRSIAREPVPHVTVSPGSVPGTFLFRGDAVYGVTVNDLSGRVILQRSFYRPVELITLSNASAGLYIFTVITKKGSVSLKILKN